MVYSASHIASILAPNSLLAQPDAPVRYLLTDSRHLLQAADTLFFALEGPRRSGNAYVAALYEQGVRNFVVRSVVDTVAFSGANFFVVPDPLQALQQLVQHHREQFFLPVIGITGSNGKTIVKEWLYQLLQEDEKICRNPRSYNSQVGVPLSVWQLADEHSLGIFEAGISQPGEMRRLHDIIQPTIGVFTNLGDAHSAGFESDAAKAKEKAQLFEGVAAIITQEKYQHLFTDATLFTWGKSEDNEVVVKEIQPRRNSSKLVLSFDAKTYTITIPFADTVAQENALHCCAVLLYLGKDLNDFNNRFAQLHAVDMRLQFFDGINGCTIINDSYSADITSFSLALAFMTQQQTGQARTVILSDFMESGRTANDLYRNVANALAKYGVQKVIGIGPQISELLPTLLASSTNASFFASTDEFLCHFRTSSFHNETILVKGARLFQFERIAHHFEQKVHQTVLQINLNAMVHNIRQYQALLQHGTRMMAMVKAFSYGSGGAEIASVLQQNNVDYLGVAYVDEGVDLRREGISLPIMVINADASSFDAIVDHNLQPVIYSEELLDRFETYISGQGLSSWPVHLEVETGMNRLGFDVGSIAAIGQRIAEKGLLKIETVFSHLAASEDPAQDAFTGQQAQTFEQAVALLQQHIPYPFIRHIANSAAIIRHPDLHFDMVRLGIGLYGIETVSGSVELQPVATLRSTIAQLKQLQPGDTVSYNRRGAIDQPSLIATVRIGYADGYSRRFSNGVGKMWVRGQLVPVIGTVCMDMTMIDVTAVPGVQEGDEVIIFGQELPVQQLAQWGGTIPYEIMTGISQRVKRVYYQE
jgi:Alr-MurF fusion protein